MQGQRTWAVRGVACGVALMPLLAACQPGESSMPNTPNLPASPDLRFTCVANPDPGLPVTPEADAIFQKARAMERAEGPKDFDSIARTYEQAVALGHWKAMHNAQIPYYQGLTTHPDPAQRVIDLNEKLIELGAAIGYHVADPETVRAHAGVPGVCPHIPGAVG